MATSSALELVEELGHEEVVFVHDAETGLRAVIAIHDTLLGPAVGGTRMRVYPRFEDAVVDALRLSRAMTYKAAMAGIPRGGGQAVIGGNPARDKSRGLLLSYAKAVERLGGRFQTGGDMGIDSRDLAVMARSTSAVHSGEVAADRDVPTLTAIGVVEGIRAAARVRGARLDDVHVAVQGLGQVGAALARRLAVEGARLTIADIDAGRVERVQAETSALSVPDDDIYDVAADVFSPNAAGGVLSAATLPRLRCRAIVGAADEQLADAETGDALHERGILYAPDYVASAGGLYSLLAEGDDIDVIDRVREIGPRLAELFDRSREEEVPTHRLADQIVEERRAAAREERQLARRPRPPEASEWENP